MTDESDENLFRVNYSIRPAKCIERKMILEALHRLNVFHEPKSYQYVGFGSAFFSDFVLVHKSLGIRDMVSIEKDDVHKQRYLDNCPFKCIDLRFGHSNHILPSLPLSKPVIVWLDYTCRLNDSELEDVRYVCSKAVSGSFIIVTVNADSLGSTGSDVIRRKLRTTNSDYGPVYEQYYAKYDKKAAARTYREIIHEEIGLVLRNRTGVLPVEEKLNCQQIFNFEYRDSKDMLTYGGIIFKNRDLGLLNKCKFNTCDCYRPSDVPYEIEIPILTLREIRMLDSQLPNNGSSIVRGSIPAEEVAKYVNLYRFYPSFVEAEL